jgi:hypothetical protein
LESDLVEEMGDKISSYIHQCREFTDKRTRLYYITILVVKRVVVSCASINKIKKKALEDSIAEFGGIQNLRDSLALIT